VKILAIALVTLAAGSAAVAPSDLLVAEDVPAGFELADATPTDLTFDDYAELSPDSVAHVDPDSSGALSMRVGVDVWTSDDSDALLREVTRWATETDARAFVEQAVVIGVENGFDRRDPPFDGAVAFVWAEDGLWTRMVSWQQGRYAVSLTYLGIFEGSSATIDEAATELRDRITAETGQAVTPSEVTESEVTESEAEAGASNGGIGIGTALLWIVVIGGVTWLIMRLRRRAAGGARESASNGDRDRDRPDGVNSDEPADVDDLIERARARSRAEREIDAIPDPTEPGWTPPDDY